MPTAAANASTRAAGVSHQVAASALPKSATTVSDALLSTSTDGTATRAHPADATHSRTTAYSSRTLQPAPLSISMCTDLSAVSSCHSRGAVV